MAERSDDDWHRLLTGALLRERPFPEVNGVARAADGLWLLLETERPGLPAEIGERYGVSVGTRVIGAIAPAAQGGDPVGAGAGSLESGTLGCLVSDAAGTVYGLTCDHVVGALASQKISDPIIVPSSRKSGVAPGNTVGSYGKGGTVVLSASRPNKVDAALVTFSAPGSHRSSIHTIGPLAGSTSAISFGDTVEKYGDKSGHTRGNYAYKVSHLLTYAAGTALFVDQLGIDTTQPPFAETGDSGAIVVDSMHKAVGLLFAASATGLGFANPIDDVLSTFGVAVV